MKLSLYAYWAMSAFTDLPVSSWDDSLLFINVLGDISLKICCEASNLMAWTVGNIGDGFKG